MIYDTYDTQLRLVRERFEDEVRQLRLLRAARPRRRAPTPVRFLRLRLRRAARAALRV